MGQYPCMVHHVLNLRVVQALKKSQKRVGKQAKQIKSLRNEVALIRDQLEISLDSMAPTAKRGTVVLAFEGGNLVAGLGKKFAMVVALWTEPDTFDSLRNFMGHPNTSENSATDDSYRDTLLYNLIPKHLLQHVDKKEFQTAVRLCFLLIINCFGANHIMLSLPQK